MTVTIWRCFPSFEPQLKWFYKWWIQLFAESEGKCGKGLFPVASEYSEELHSVGQFVQDGSPILFETFLDIKEQQSSLICNPDEVDDRFGYLDGKDFWEINKGVLHGDPYRTCTETSLPDTDA